MRFCFEHTVPLARERVFEFFEYQHRIETLYAGWSIIRVMPHTSIGRRISVK
jgi:hypothetical protein